MSEAEVKRKAFNIAQSFDSTNIEIFRSWSYVPRGQAGIWYRNSGDSSVYRVVYLPQADSTKLWVVGQEEFIKDFSTEFPLDTTLWRIAFIRDKSGTLKISGINNNGKDAFVASNVNQDSIFPQSNPFDKFEELTNLKDSLGFFGVQYYKGLGGLIEFQLSAEHILTYVPDINLIEQPFRKVWESDFSKGQWIKKNWNLRKLDKPIDNG
ncbi:hypothetical protein [Pontibacter sp. H249]|uniref:hypothetical protein n=1 Tax=Pontibacter sp. H249 TaxID=3133420 RepID=UPI0030BA4B32